MKNKFLVALMTGCVLAMAVGCTSQEETATDAGFEEMAPEFATDESQAQTESEPEETAEAPAEESKETAEDTQQSASSDIADGTWSAYLDNTRKDDAGKVGEVGEPMSIIYDGGLEGDVLSVVGVLAPDPYDPTGFTADGSHALKLTDSTEFVMSGGDTGPETVTKEEFGEHFKNCLGSGGLAFEVVIEGGAVKKVTISA
ncbi:hypothetical protein [Butyrivibrio sp. INlla21]|uniref:hypothetical protein n=1 Tax=Butyrivibrio sp. INlla21 TaxID=1520811 RepID=UPI0008F3A542|nr:hypothetical protein [Butyrivibrio sp. INlla21]SFU34598.1 hypothetical protein SAMN02910342_00173 [Butyrivibrio sp. INlla21]